MHLAIDIVYQPPLVMDAVGREWKLCAVLETFWGQEALLLLTSLWKIGSVAIMGASATHLSKLDSTQKMAERFSGCKFPSLHSHREASVVRLLCKLLGSWGRGPLQHFCPAITTTPSTHAYSLRSLNCDPLLLFTSLLYIPGFTL